MIDVHLLREQPDEVAAALARRGWERAEVEEVIALDDRRRELIGAVDDARAEQREVSQRIGGADPDERPALIEEAGEWKERVAELEAELEEAAEAADEALARVPNLPAEEAPEGGEGEGEVVDTVGSPPEHDFETADHVELLTEAGALDLERAAKTSGARFAYLIGDGARLELALAHYALDAAEEHGHVPVVPPVMVRREAMYGTGFLPTDEQQLFRTDERDDYYLVGTSEVPLASFHADEILAENDLPTRYAGWSPCFRREAGSHGQDTRGIFRVHQFEKVELFSFVDPERSAEEHQRILSLQRRIFSDLGLHFRVVDIPVGDLGASAARKFDLEAWIPSQRRYREITSTSNTTDYQARRLRVRVRRGQGDNRTLHTLNGTAVAIQRAIIALVETHQRPDGTVAVPAVLQPYLGGREVLLNR